MPDEFITISVGGTVYSAFESMSVSAAFDEAARSFEMTVAAEFGASGTASVFRAGAAVDIRSNGDLLLKGYVDHFKPSLTATSYTIGISGRSKSQDAIDSSAKHKTGRIEKKDPVKIAKEVSEGVDVEITTDQSLDMVEAYQITPGETIFRCLEKMARAQGCTVTGTADGGMKVTKVGQKRHSGGLFEGRNIKVGDADHDWSNRHSEYTVKGQRAAGHGKDALELEAVAKDGAVNRFRPIIVIQRDDTDKKKIKKRAETRRDKAAGNGLTATITTQGFRDEGGKLWEPGYLVWVESPSLDIRQDMAIKSVAYSQSSEGSLAKLELCDPRAFGGKAGKGNKSGSDWNQGDGEASEG
jgi:prophage tail gpP-like protein